MSKGYTFVTYLSFKILFKLKSNVAFSKNNQYTQWNLLKSKRYYLKKKT